MIDKPLNILIVASWYPSAHSPAEGSFIEEQAQMLKKEGHQITILHPYILGTFLSTFFDKKFSKYEKWNGIPVLRIGTKPTVPRQRELAYKKLYSTCKKQLKRNRISIDQFDIIHSHAMFMGGYVAMNLANEFKKCFYHTEHTSGFIFHPKQYNFQDHKVIFDVFNTAKKNFFVSNFALEKTLDQFSMKRTDSHQVLHNLVDDIFFETISPRPEKTPFKYISICNLIPRKRVDLLLKSWSELIKKYPDSLLTIAGDGPEKDKLISLVSLLELDCSVKFLTRLGRDEVKKEITSHHVLVSTSELETFGLTVAEAQAIGIPVVVTDSGGVRDIVSHETGIIADQSVENFAQGLISIRKNYDMYKPSEIRKRAHQSFSSDVIYKKLLTIYKSALV